MNCLVILYDREQVNNLIPIFSFIPNKVVILYDKNYTSSKKIDYIKFATLLRFPNIQIDSSPYDGLNIEDITKSCVSIIHKNSDCFFDITGAGEFGAIGAYQACKKTFTPIFKLDPLGKRLINVYGCDSLEKSFTMPNLNIEDVLSVNGARLAGYNHKCPSYDDFDSIMKFSEAIFSDINEWKSLCLYLQTGNTKFNQSFNSLYFHAPKTIENSKNSPIHFGNPKLLHLAQKLKLIQKLKINSKKVSFFFRDKDIKRYMTDFGVWLELFCYISLKRCPSFHDVRMSIMIDWEAEKKHLVETVNEIDVTFFYGIRSYFISCKLSEPSSEALHELSMYPSYFGGNYSKSALVILSNINKERSHIYTRAKDMNITVIDGKSLRSGNFINDIKSSLDNIKIV